MDWNLFTQIAGPVAALPIGAVIDRALERRSKLISFMPYTSAVTVRPPSGQPFQVHSHSLVVQNAGRRAAVNVRLGHAVMPINYSVYPSVLYHITQLPDGGVELLFPTLVPGEQITVVYLYYQPITWDRVHSYVKSDEGAAKVVKILMSTQLSPWKRRLLLALATLGAISTIYALWEGAVSLLKVVSRIVN